MEAMADMEDNAFELAIIDPPYGIMQDGRKNHTRGCLAKSKNYLQKPRYDNSAPSKKYFIELLRVSKNQILWGGNHYAHKLPSPSSPAWIVWDKDNGKTDFADCELAYTSFNSAVRKFKWRWQGMLQENMSLKEILEHPNQKPIALYKWLLKNYANEGDRILDTHLGSGSIAIACHDMGFDLEAYEIDQEYYQASLQRLNTHRSQLQMF